MAASKSPQLRLLHIRDEIDGVMAALRDVSFDEYCKSFTLRRAAERAVQIVSEAAKALPPELTDRDVVEHVGGSIGRGGDFRSGCGDGLWHF